MTDAVLLYIPCPSREEAVRLARHLLERRVVACANLASIDSLYWWKGAIEEGPEVAVLAKTLPDRADAAEAAVRGAHPYEVPCIARMAVQVNDDFGAWMRGNLG